jgi:hypothetical protein
MRCSPEGAEVAGKQQAAETIGSSGSMPLTKGGGGEMDEENLLPRAAAQARSGRATSIRWPTAATALTLSALSCGDRWPSSTQSCGTTQTTRSSIADDGSSRLSDCSNNTLY